MNKQYLYRPFEKQKEFEEAIMSYKYNFILYGGAIRGGKTYSLLAIFIILCKIFPGSRWAIIRESLPMIRLHVFPVFNRLVPESFVKKMPSSSNNWTCTFKNGSQIIFFSENYSMDKDHEKFKGLEVDGIGVEEISGLHETTFTKLFERIGTWKMKERNESIKKGELIPPRIIAATSNPTQNWLKDKIYDPHVKGELNPKFHYIQSRVYDNPHIDPEWIDMLRSTMPSVPFRRFVDGDWEATENNNPWAYEFDYYKHVFNDDIDIIPDLDLWISFDFNYKPTTCIVAQGTDEFCNIIAEHQVNGGGTEKLCELIKSKYGQYHLMVTGDASGYNHSTTSHKNDYMIIKDVLGLNERRFKVRRQNRALTESQTLCNSWLFSFPEVQISGPNCKTLVKELRTAVNKDSGKGHFVKDRADNKMDHFDCWRYLVDAMYPDFIKNFRKYVA